MHVPPTLLLIVAPANASPTQTYILQPAGPWETWTPIALGFAQFCVLAWITWYVFVDGSRQKVAEREATWYHKIVVDHSIQAMSGFFAIATKALCVCSIDLLQLADAKTEAAYDQKIRETLAAFKKSLAEMRNDVSGRLAFFDAKTHSSFLARTDRLEDEIALWFDAYKKAQAYDHRTSLPEVLNSCQSELLGIIKQYEFNQWGWPRKHRRKTATAAGYQ
jgi:hypothetical protein